MPQTYRTSAGDVVDAIAFKQYGQSTDATLAAILDANPGLAGMGAVLPAGVLVTLPDIPAATVEQQALSLWD